jgi:hypothetical protein
LPALLLAGLLLRRQGWHRQSGKLSVLGMFALHWVAAKVDGGFKRARNAVNGPTDVAEELPAAVAESRTSPTESLPAAEPQRKHQKVGPESSEAAANSDVRVLDWKYLSSYERAVQKKLRDARRKRIQYITDRWTEYWRTDKLSPAPKVQCQATRQRTSFSDPQLGIDEAELNRIREEIRVQIDAADPLPAFERAAWEKRKAKFRQEAEQAERNALFHKNLAVARDKAQEAREQAAREKEAQDKAREARQQAAREKKAREKEAQDKAREARQQAAREAAESTHTVNQHNPTSAAIDAMDKQAPLLIALLNESTFRAAVLARLLIGYEPGTPHVLIFLAAVFRDICNVLPAHFRENEHNHQSHRQAAYVLAEGTLFRGAAAPDGYKPCPTSRNIDLLRKALIEAGFSMSGADRLLHMHADTGMLTPVRQQRSTQMISMRWQRQNHPQLTTALESFWVRGMFTHLHWQFIRHAA